ncbi:MAG: glycosyltransferase family protein, partial [Verrucomicrobiota bacterium]
MKALFLVNGTGMGHITQTFALVELFARHGAPLTPVAVMVTNCSPSKVTLLREYYKCPVVEAPSLRFHTNAAGEISQLRTAWGSLCDLGNCLRSVTQLHALVAETRPDVVINFYEALGGFYHLRHRVATPWIAVAHQYMVDHPSYLRYARFHPQRQVLKWLTRLTGFGSKLRVAM